MKSRDQILRRIDKLYNRYRLKYIDSHTEKRPDNCVHNLKVFDSHTVEDPVEHRMAPRKSVTLFVLNTEPGSARICTYGKNMQWNGSVCDKKSISDACPMYTPRTSAEDAGAEFDRIVQDDEYVADKYPDIAALQWVTESRPWSFHRNVWGKMRIFIHGVFNRFSGKS